MIKEQFQQEVIELLNLTPSELPQQATYQSAFVLYQAKEYRKAGALFTQLALSNPFYPPYWKGLAACQQMAKEYEAALHAWQIAALLCPDDPETSRYAAECLIQMERPHDVH